MHDYFVYYFTMNDYEAVFDLWRQCEGIGRGLVVRSVKCLADEGIQKGHLFIFNDNASGTAFWKSIGWNPRTDIGVISKNITAADIKP